MDYFSKSDPMCVLFVKEFGRDRWSEFGRTETIWNNLNPEWVKKFQMNYYFEERQYLKFEIYDIDSKSTDLSSHDFLGKFECTLGEIVSQGRIEKPLLDGPAQNSGKIIVIGSEEVSSCKEELILKLSGKKLDKKDWFGKSDPFLTFYRQNADGSMSVVHRTPPIKNTLNPDWPEFRIEARKLCQGDYNKLFLVKCFDWNKNGDEDLIGEFRTNVNEMLKVNQSGQAATFEIHNSEKRKSCGQIILHSISVQQILTFLDFVQKG
uniref:Copine-3 n=1 Tax=Romanomermis culicivorax TaxID=13658 RepID=A0A915KCS4_ROMCU